MAQSSAQGPMSLSCSWINRARRAGVHLCRPAAQARTHPSKEGLVWAGPQIDLAVGILSGCAGWTAQGQLCRNSGQPERPLQRGGYRSSCPREREGLEHAGAGLSLQSSPQNRLVRTSGGWTLLPGRRAGCSQPQGASCLECELLDWITGFLRVLRSKGLMFREAGKD